MTFSSKPFRKTSFPLIFLQTSFAHFIIRWGAVGQSDYVYSGTQMIECWLITIVRLRLCTIEKVASLIFLNKFIVFMNCNISGSEMAELHISWLTFYCSHWGHPQELPLLDAPRCSSRTASSAGQEMTHTASPCALDSFGALCDDHDGKLRGTRQGCIIQGYFGAT